MKYEQLKSAARKLSTNEQLDLIQTLEADLFYEVPNEIKGIVKERLAAYKKGDSKLNGWEDVKSRIKKDA